MSINELLVEWSYRTEKGYPDMGNPSDILILKEILENLGLPVLPDGKFLPPMDLNCVEDHFKDIIEEKFGDRTITIGRVAHITQGTKEGQGRGPCQYRNRCIRGCPFGAYFSSNSSTLPTAEAT